MTSCEWTEGKDKSGQRVASFLPIQQGLDGASLMTSTDISSFTEAATLFTISQGQAIDIHSKAADTV